MVVYVGGLMGGRVNRNYSLLIPKLGLGFGAELGNYAELVYVSFVPQ